MSIYISGLIPSILHSDLTTIASRANSIKNVARTNNNDSHESIPQTHPDADKSKNVDTSSPTNDSKSFPQLPRMTAPTIHVHCIEQHASTAIE